jgi:predicted CoA-substrate-specific enzyme activase
MKKQYFAGVDIGSTMTKVVIMDGEIAASVIGPTGPEHRKLANRVMEEALAKAKLSFDAITYLVATGYGRINVPFADRQITEISCHARGVSHLLPGVKTVIDIGGQDSKAIKLKDGRAVDFVMNDRCAAGTGRFLEVTAEGLGVRLEDMGRLSLEAKNKVEIGSTCTVFAAQEVVAQLAAGAALPDIIAGLHEAIASRVIGMARRLKIERQVAVTGGGAKNIGLVRALEAKLGYSVLLPPEPLLTGAIGAALLGKDIVKKAEESGETLVKAERRLTEASIFT